MNTIVGRLLAAATMERIMDFRYRKHPRLKDYDYSRAGYYYVTIHTERNVPPLSVVVQKETPTIALSAAGKIAEQQLFALETRFPYVRIDKYVIMPTHIHAIIVLDPGGYPRPGLPEIVRAYKSLTARLCNQTLGTVGQSLFQTSFYESVLRNERAYQECWRYIDENPAKWLLDPEDL